MNNTKIKVQLLYKLNCKISYLNIKLRSKITDKNFMFYTELKKKYEDMFTIVLETN